MQNLPATTPTQIIPGTTDYRDPMFQGQSAEWTYGAGAALGVGDGVVD